jgi:CubicO group peptidase (beta-lactamase class C family)
MKFQFSVVFCVLLSQVPLLAFADHEPASYSFQASKRHYHSKFVAELPPSKDFVPWRENLNSDSTIKARLDRILTSEPKVALAAVALKNGSIIYEKQLNAEQTNLYPSWSMAKSMTSIVVGYALCEGKIQSLDDKADKYSANLRNTAWGEAKIRDLLMMSSGANRKGLEIDGDYRDRNGSGPSWLMTRNRLTVKEALRTYGQGEGRTQPGQVYSYNNLDTEALGQVVAGATGRNYQDYFQQTLWKDIGAEHRSVWYLDSDRQALASAYFFASLRDFARIAQHIIDIYKGRAGDICMQNYVKEAVSRKIRMNEHWWYGYQFPVPRPSTALMLGHQGQTIKINFDTERVVILTAYREEAFKKWFGENNLFDWLQSKSD